MDVLERSQNSLNKTNKFQHIPLTFRLNHLNGRTRLGKVGPQGVLTYKEDKLLTT